MIGDHHLPVVFSFLVTGPSHRTRVAGWTVFTSTRLQQVTAPNMKNRPKDLGLDLKCKSFFSFFLTRSYSLHPVQQREQGTDS